MSSPRVLRTVAMSPACINTSRKRSIASGEERWYWIPGNGLNGIRLILHGTSLTSAASSRAWGTPSLTPVSITYSNMM